MSDAREGIGHRAGQLVGHGDRREEACTSVGPRGRRFHRRRIVPQRLAIVLQAIFYALAAVVIIVTAPNHDASYASGVVIALVLAPLSVATLYGGMTLQRRTQPA